MPPRPDSLYTHDDVEFLEAIAASLALLVERPALGTETAARDIQDSRELQECPKCGACYESASTNCSADGTMLVPSGLPRILAGRYQLERHRGHGGMGTVYEAKDCELERRVAVKLIREDWSGRVDALQRFHREARAAAGFSYPNVVTVHDYGVDKFLPVTDDATPTRTKAETSSGVLLGTPAYMSPEQLLGGKLDRQWDLWALAVIAYEVLTGSLPFDISGPDWQRAVISRNFMPPSLHRAEAPTSWESFFRGCFSTDRGARPATAAEFFERLVSALS